MYQKMNRHHFKQHAFNFQTGCQKIIELWGQQEENVAIEAPQGVGYMRVLGESGGCGMPPNNTHSQSVYFVVSRIEV